MLFLGGQYGKMAACIVTSECTVKPVIRVFAEGEALIPYMKPPIRTLCAVDRCRERWAQANMQVKHL